MFVREKHIILSVLVLIVIAVDSKKPKFKEDTPQERRDYRPSKWVSNSAMDVWYGNKTMVDILSRELMGIMGRFAGRPVRSTNEFYYVSKKEKQEEEEKLQEISKHILSQLLKAYSENVKKVKATDIATSNRFEDAIYQYNNA